MKGVVCDGNSITVGYGLSSPDTYPEQLGVILGVGYAVVNAGVNGQTLQDMINAPDDVDDAYDVGYAQNWLVAAGGVNDLEAGVSAATCFARLETYLAARRAVGFNLLVCSVLPAGSLDAAAETQRLAYNTLLRDGWHGLADRFVDLAVAAQLDDETDETYYQPDRVHPTAVGAGVIAVAVADELLIPPGRFASVFAGVVR